MTLKFLLACSLALLAAATQAASPKTASLEGLPRYTHVFVIIDENKDFDRILSGADAPNIAALAKAYGMATNFFGEVHPSEANYVALLGGDTFGIHDDDAFYCTPGSVEAHCGGARAPGYAAHALTARHLGDQLTAAGLSWKGYYQSLPAPGSLAVTAGDAKFSPGSENQAIYASKHSAFLNFISVIKAADRARRIVGFDQLSQDLATGQAPNFALIVPNQCDDMHGLHGAGIPADCDAVRPGPLIHRGDVMIGALVARIKGSAVWRSAGNVAIVITFDEGGGGGREGCCGVTPSAVSNFGGGHIPTLVITNHGPSGLRDSTPYNHYSLLRTLEDVFGIGEYLGHAAQSAKGVVPMTPLFATTHAHAVK